MRIFNKTYPDILVDPNTGEEYHTIDIAKGIREEYSSFDESVADSYISVYFSIYRAIQLTKLKTKKYYFNQTFFPIYLAAYTHWRVTGKRKFKHRDVKPFLLGYSREWWKKTAKRLQHSGLIAYPSERLYEITDDLILCFKTLSRIYPEVLSLYLNTIDNYNNKKDGI